MKRLVVNFLFLILGLFCISNVAATDKDKILPTVSYVDLERYMGTWHEIARLPNWFEKKAVYSNVKAEYELNKQRGYVKVHNSYQDDKGKIKSAYAIAFVVDKQTNSELKVSFAPFLKYFGLFAAPYYIIALDEKNYQYAMVGTPDRKYLWILCRQSTIDQRIYQSLISQAEKLGFDTTKIYIDPKNKA